MSARLRGFPPESRLKLGSTGDNSWVSVMITKIGIVAGEIWHLLEKTKDISLSKLVEKIDKPESLIFMSLGWLAREGHVLLKKYGNEYRVRLR